ncbi:hypothetical protein ACP4OV_011866 [Aristida adscensionis]
MGAAAQKAKPTSSCRTSSWTRSSSASRPTTPRASSVRPSPAGTGAASSPAPAAAAASARATGGRLPLLGLVHNTRDGGGGGGEEVASVARFAPASSSSSSSSFRPPRAAGPRGLHALDARHGRVLLHNSPWGVEPPDNVLFVWDPITDELQQPPELPAEDPDLYDPAWNAAVLCAAPAAGCDHLDCRRGPFLVVLVATGISGTAACVYSSEAGAWNGPTYAQPGQAINGRVNLGPSALVGNALYFLFYWGPGILKYNLATQEMSVIPLATAYPSRLVLMAMEGGGLGVAGVDDAALYIWSRKDEDDRWIQSKAIDLKKLLPVDALEGSIYLYGFVDGANVIFILANHELYSIDLKSSQTIKIDLGVGPIFYNVVPYMSFYTPDQASNVASGTSSVAKTNLCSAYELRFWRKLNMDAANCHPRL